MRPENKPLRRIAGKVLKITGIAFGSILLLMLILPWLLPGLITNKIKQWASTSINGELHFSRVRLSFFKHFPSLTLSMHDVVLKGSAPYQRDTLLAGDDIALGVDISSVFSSRLRVNKVILTDAFINVQVDEQGRANYNIYNADSSRKKKNADSASVDLSIEKIRIKRSRLVYNDHSMPMRIDLRGLNYEGTGDLSKAVFDLQTKMDIDSLDFYYGNTPYFLHKKINASLITKINTNSLALIFEKNDIVINQLPLQFNGAFEFLSNGYNINFQLNAKNTSLRNLFSALPPELVSWVEKRNVTGTADIAAVLKGKYIVAQNAMPDLWAQVKIRDGYVGNKKAPSPITHLFLDLETRLPHLNTDSLLLKIDSIYFNMGKDYFSAGMLWKGMKTPDIDVRLRSAIDLGKWCQAIAPDNFTMGGYLWMDLSSKGRFDAGKKQLPITSGHVDIRNGSIQTAYYQGRIEQLTVNTRVTNQTGDYKGLQLVISPIAFQFEGQPFKLEAKLANFDNLQYDIVSKGTIPLGKLYQLFAVPGYAVDGVIKTDLSLHGNHADAAAGRYDKLSNSGQLEVNEVRLGASAFAHPLLVRSGLFTFNQDKMRFKRFKGMYGNNTIIMNGYLLDVISYTLQQGLPLKGRFDLESDRIVVDDFMEAEDTATTASGGMVIVPRDLALAFGAQVKEVVYGDLSLKNFSGSLHIDSGQIRLKQTAFTIIDAPVTMAALYKPVSATSALFDYHIKADSFSIQKAYKEIRLFRELATAAEKAAGIVSLDYQLSGRLDGNMYPVFPSLKGGGVLTLQQVKVKGLKLFGAVSKQTNRDVNDPDLSKVSLKTSIKNNIITLERTRMRIAGFRPRIEGEMNFDGQMNLSFRLGLPPFGIIGIPLSITGTQDDPKVRVRRSKKGDKLEEVEDVDESEAAEGQ